MSSISIRHAAISVRRKGVDSRAGNLEQDQPKKRWFTLSDALALLGAAALVALVKFGVLGALPF